MRSMLFASLFMMVISSCTSDTESTQNDTVINRAIMSDTCFAWKTFFESSDVGLWEDDSSHFLTFTDVLYLVNPDDEFPLVYDPYALCADNDTVFIADLATQKIHALDRRGNHLWEIGGEGEGPGEFPYISTIAVSSIYVAAINNRLGRIDFFLRNGDYSHSHPLQHAQDIVAIDDTTFIVGSTNASEGDLHLLSSSRGVVESFGEIPQDHYTNIRRLDLIRLCFNGADLVAVFNRYEGFISIYEINSGNCVFSGCRTYPMLPTPPMPLDEAGRHRHFPVGGNCFVGAEGMLNVTLPNVMNDSTFISTPDYMDYAPVTVVDRYDWDGNYLDSYCLPDSCLSYSVLVDSVTFAVLNYAEGAVKLLTTQ